jgi:hypothetical protein
LQEGAARQPNSELLNALECGVAITVMHEQTSLLNSRSTFVVALKKPRFMEI